MFLKGTIATTSSTISHEKLMGKIMGNEQPRWRGEMLLEKLCCNDDSIIVVQYPFYKKLGSGHSIKSFLI